jgi:two-component system, probable response regulator PhcQ
MTSPNDIAPVILFVDDEADTAKYFQRSIGSLAPVATAGSVEEGKIALDKYAGTLLVLVSDQRMPRECGNELLRYARSRYPHMVRILTTAYSEMDSTVEAINEGHIHRYIRKPWDIASLRMELKQAIEFAEVRSERDQLLREKLIVRQAQIVANRIGMLHTICVNLHGPGHSPAIDAYLAAAHKAWVKAPEPNWVLMDYCDLVSAEALRSGEFGYRVRTSLASLEQRYKDCSIEAAVKALSAALGDKIQLCGQGVVVFPDERILVEFLETQCNEPVSSHHAAWLAFLIWLDGIAGTVQLTRSGVGLQCRLIKRGATVAPTELAVWIEQF